MKRYAIVRVECPPKNEIDAQFVCFPKDNNCSGCRYGDTKEQLVKKIAQAIFKKINDFGGKWQNKIWTEADKRYSYKLAKQIIEFLGVEE